METSIRKIAILTSGGDAPGMNPAIKALVEDALEAGLEPYFVYEGYKGLVENNIKKASLEDVQGIEDKGGTILYSSRLPEFKEEEVRKKAKENLDALGIDALVVIGGDGSFMGAKLLSDLGVKTVGIPGTIDNDIQSSDFTLGFFTAVNTIDENILKVRDTAESHNRLIIVEVMGHGAGDLAIWSGLDTDADIVSSQPTPLSEDQIIERAAELRAEGRRSIIVIVSEFIYDVEKLQAQIEQKTGIESRSVVLGHPQRGGAPAEEDKKLASILAKYSIKELLDNKTAITVGVKDWKPYSTDITKAVEMERPSYEKIVELYNKERGN